MENYKEIKFGAGESIESAMKTLQEHNDKGDRVYGVFNGQKLYSDVDDIDSAYLKLTGKTKSEHNDELKRLHDEYEERKRKHKESIPELTKEWIEKGRKILDEKYMSKWTECVPIRLDDMYEGMELGNCLEIVEKLNEGCELEQAIDIVNGQGHSGTSYIIVCSMVGSFCDRGQEFLDHVNKKNA